MKGQSYIMWINFHDDESEIRQMSNTNVESFTDMVSVNSIGNADAVIGVVSSLVDSVVNTVSTAPKKLVTKYVKLVGQHQNGKRLIK